MPTLTWLDSFYHRDAAAVFYGTNNGIYDTQSRPAGKTFVTGRRGAGSVALQIVEDGATSTRVGKTIAAGNRTVVESFYIKISAAPSVDSYFWQGIAFINSDIGMNTAGNIFWNAGTGGNQVSAGTYTDGADHRIDLKFVTSATTYTLDIYIDGASQTQQVSNTTTAADITETRLGSTNAAHTLTVQFSDWVRSVTAGDYPIGGHQCLPLVPTTDGTHNWASTNMGNQSGGTASSVSTLHNEVDDWDGTNAADTATYIAYTNTTATATEYAEILVPDVVGGTVVWAARAIAAVFSATTTANSAVTRVVDGSNATVCDVWTGDMSDTSLRHISKMVTGVTSDTLLNALKFRVGFPSDSNPAPRWSALMVDYAVPGDTSIGPSLVTPRARPN